jgi:hypothetical protein
MLKNKSAQATSRSGRHAEGETAACRSHGNVEAAPGLLRPLGCNPGMSRPIETVRMVSWKLNLMPNLGGAELLSHMSDEERVAAGLGAVAAPCWAVAAVDCRTRAVLGMELGRSLEGSTAESCLKMITRDKGPVFSPAGVEGPWNQHGMPERIVVDSGALFASAAFVEACDDLGFTIERTIVGVQASRDVLERGLQTTIYNLLSEVSWTSAFLILQSALAPRAPDYVRAAVVRRIVGLYHDAPQAALGGKTPERYGKRTIGATTPCCVRLIGSRGTRPSRRDTSMLKGAMTGTPPADAAQKLAELRSRHVPNQRDREFREQLDRLLQVEVDGSQLPKPVRFTRDLETRGIAMIDGPGGGKTTTIARTLRKNTALNPADGPRWVGLQVPNPASLKSLGLEILRATGFQGVSERARVWEIWNVVRHRMAELEIALLWIDEAHDLFSSRSDGEIDNMLKTLKSLMQGPSPVIVVLSGTERLAEMTSVDPQVNRRFTKVIPRPFAVGASEKEVGELVALCAREAGLALDWSPERSSRLIHASRGRFGRMIETIINAIERAFSDGNSTLTSLHFAEAWGMQEGCLWHENVFVAEDWASRALDEAAENFEMARVEHRRKKRKVAVR